MKLRHRVEIQRPTTSGNDLAGIPEVWGTWLREFAQIKPLSGRELERAGRVAEDVSHRVTLRWSEDTDAINNSHRVTYGARTFEVVASFNVEERNQWVELLCVEKG